MPRHRKPRTPAPTAGPAPVIIVCRDSYHHDEDGYADRGYHLVGELRHVPPAADAPGGLQWSGRPPEHGPLRTPGITIAANLPLGAPPVKRYRSGDGPTPWRLRCPCGLDPQPTEARLAEIVSAWAKEFPGRPVEIDLCRL